MNTCLVMLECYGCRRIMEDVTPAGLGGPRIYWCRSCGQQVSAYVGINEHGEASAQLVNHIPVVDMSHA